MNSGPQNSIQRDQENDNNGISPRPKTIINPLYITQRDA